MTTYVVLTHCVRLHKRHTDNQRLHVVFQTLPQDLPGTLQSSQMPAVRQELRVAESDPLVASEAPQRPLRAGMRRQSALSHHGLRSRLRKRNAFFDQLTRKP